jgi:hypothetical protein
MKRTDWMPGKRAEVLAMCRNWLAYLTPERRAAWGIPEAVFGGLADFFAAAGTWLERWADAGKRTRVVTVQTRAAFKALKDAMRGMKDRYFRMPPLLPSDWAALGFRPKRGRVSRVPAPEGTPSVFLSYPGGPHALTAHLGLMAGLGEDETAGDYGYALYLGIMPPGGATLEEAASRKRYLRAPPQDGDDLLYYRFSRRRKEKIIFDAEDAGKTAWVCARYENGRGKTGLWGPVVSAVIP